MEILTATGQFEHRSYIANPTQQWGNTAPLANGSLGMTSSGMSVDSTRAMQAAAVYGATNLISDTIATLPIHQWKMNKSGEATAMDSAPVIAQPWVPWPEFSQTDFITQGTSSYLLNGNIFGNVLGRDDMGLPTQVEIWNPDYVTVKRAATGAIEVWYRGQPVPDSQLTRSMGRSVAGGIAGVSPIGVMRNQVALALAQDMAAGAFFANSARPDGVIQLPGSIDPNALQQMKTAWLEAHQGINHMHLPGFLTEGATWQSITMSMADAQFLEQMQFSASVIYGFIYRVPPHMLSQVDKDTSWGAGIEQQELGFVRNTLLFWLEKWENWMTTWLPPRQFVTFDLSKRLSGDTLQRYSAHQIARVAGFKSNLDIMREENIPIPTDPATLELLANYAQPLNSAPVKPTSTGGAGGDKSD